MIDKKKIIIILYLTSLLTGFQFIGTVTAGNINFGLVASPDEGFLAYGCDLSYSALYYASNDATTLNTSVRYVSNETEVFNGTFTGSGDASLQFANQHNYLAMWNGVAGGRQFILNVDTGLYLLERTDTMLTAGKMQSVLWSYDDSFVLSRRGQLTGTSYFGIFNWNSTHSEYMPSTHNLTLACNSQGYAIPSNNDMSKFVLFNSSDATYTVRLYNITYNTSISGYDLNNTGCYHLTINSGLYYATSGYNNIGFLWYGSYGYLITARYYSGSTQLVISKITNTSITYHQHFNLQSSAGMCEVYMETYPDGSVYAYYEDGSRYANKYFACNYEYWSLYGENLTHATDNSAYRPIGTSFHGSYNYLIIRSAYEFGIFRVASGVGEMPDFGDTSSYTKKSVNTPPSGYSAMPYKYLEFSWWETPYTGWIRGFDIYVHKNQYNYVSNSISDYALCINGVYIGSASYMFAINDEYYIIRWLDFNITLTNSVPLFELYCSASSYNGNYWFIATKDFPMCSYWHNQDSLFANGVKDGALNCNVRPSSAWYFIPTTITYNYNFICDYDTVHPIQYNNYLDVTILCNDTYPQCMNVKVINSTNSTVYDAVSCGGGAFSDSIWIDEEFKTGTFKIMVIDGDTYDYYNGVWNDMYSLVTNYSFLVITGDNYTYGVRVPSASICIGETVDVSFLAPVGERIYILWHGQKYPDETHGNSSFRIGNGVWKVLPALISPDYLDIYQVQLYNETGDIIYAHTFFSVYNCDSSVILTIDRNTCYLGESVYFSGHHNYPNSETSDVKIRIYLGESEVDSFKVGGNTDFSNVRYQPKEIGEYTAKLTFMDNAISRTITFNVLPESEAPTEFFDFIGDLPLEIKLILAVIIVLGITFCPAIILFGISKGTKTQTEIKVPPMLMVGFFLFGLAIDCMIGFLDASIFFIVLFVFSLVYVINDIMQKRKEG